MNKVSIDLLPVGSIVVLKSGMKKLVVIGRCQINSETNYLWDYLGCLYPEGVLGEDMNFLFNKEDIDNVIFEGYKDNEETEFLVKLEDLCKEYKK